MAESLNGTAKAIAGLVSAKADAPYRFAAARRARAQQEAMARVEANAKRRSSRIKLSVVCVKVAYAFPGANIAGFVHTEKNDSGWDARINQTFGQRIKP